MTIFSVSSTTNLKKDQIIIYRNKFPGNTKPYINKTLERDATKLLTLSQSTKKDVKDKTIYRPISLLPIISKIYKRSSL